jgi:L-malate glycosyltransferase
MVEIHQFGPIVLYGDAVGNQIVAMHDWITARGYRSKIYAPTWDSRYDAICESPDKYVSRADNVVILHHCIASPMADLALRLPEKVVLYYHNITPAEFYQSYDARLAQALIEGREQLRRHSGAPYGLAGSDYNRLEMLDAGFGRVDVLPYFINTGRLSERFDAIKAAPVLKALGDGRTNWLFVGRLAPNKRQDHIIRAFHYYRQSVNSFARLMLVGSDSTPQFADECRELTARLGLAEDVVFAGQVPDDVLAAYFKMADVFVCMSEHEGFGAPVVEAMHFGLPVVALNTAGVAMTMGDAGVLVNAPRPDAIGEMVELILRDEALRRTIVERQHARAAFFSVEAAGAALERAVSAMVGDAGRPG